MNGGDFFSTIKEGLSSLGNRLWKGVSEGKLLSSVGDVLGSLPIPIVSDVARMASPLLKTIGLGEGEGEGEGGVQYSYGYGEGVSAGRMRKRMPGRRRAGEGVLAGGEVMTRAELAEKLRY